MNTQGCIRAMNVMVTNCFLNGLKVCSMTGKDTWYSKPEEQPTMGELTFLTTAEPATVVLLNNTVSKYPLNCIYPQVSAALTSWGTFLCAWAVVNPETHSWSKYRD